MIKNGLVDELKIFINPIVLGNGNSIFHGIQNEIKLKHVNTKVVQSGNILLIYKPI
ncbi:dihydrofolate reductase family protein [Leptospira sp. WS92.C1]